MTDECKLVISEFKKIPIKELGVSIAVINCDDSNDHRKYLKKNSNTMFTLLSDPKKVLMDASKCRYI